LNKKFFIIDGYSYLYQAFYAIKALTGPKGEPTNAIYGFISMILRLLEKEKPDYLAITFDLKEPSFRHKEYKEYKATRKPMPSELISQVEVVREIVDAYRIPGFAKAGYEADDIMGTLVHSLRKDPVWVFIITRDKDVKQLLRDRVAIYDTKAGELYQADDFRKEFGFEPHQQPDYMALAGDASDNIPGVKGVGEKTARELIAKYGSLENLLKNIDSVEKESLREKLKENAETARLSKHLASLITDVPIQFSISGCALKEPDRERLVKIFQEHGFAKFISSVLSAPGEAKGVAAKPKEAVKYSLVNERKQLEALSALLGRAKEVSVDTETTSEDPFTAELVGISFSVEEGEAFYVPVRAPVGEAVLPRKDVLSHLAPILESEKIRKIGQNLKYDSIILRRLGVNLSPIWFDTMVAAYLLDPEGKGYSLENLALKYLGLKKTEIAELIGKGRNQISMDRVTSAKVCDYSCQDADFALRLCHILAPRLKENNLESLFADVEMPLVNVLIDMEYSGVSIDTDVLKGLSRQVGEKATQIEKEIYKLVGHEFNIDSHKQLSTVLFEELKLPRGKRTTTGQLATDHTVLDELALTHPLPAKIVEYRTLTKLKSTYLDAFPKMVSPFDGRVHTSFNQTGTATGRLSSSEPNLQNIPIKEEVGRQIRRAFVTRSKEYKILTSDYSQIELRLLAHFSRDAELIAAFNRGEDIHSSVASALYHVKIKDVTPTQRRHAKAVNFGIVYGLTPHGLSVGLGISHEDAKKYIDTYFQKYEGVTAFIEKVISRAREQGYVTTVLNRIRYIPGISSDDKQRRALAERLAVNTVLQGSAADLIKIAMIRIHRALKERRSKSALILQIHDELVFEIFEKDLKEEKEIIVTAMENAIPLSVPVRVNLEIGDNWLEAK
jgi:DNA polymerase-1